MRRVLRALANNALVARAVFMREMMYWLRYPLWFLTFLSFPYLISGLFYSIGCAVSGEDAIRYFSERVGTDRAFLYNLIGSAVMMIAILMIEDVGHSIRAEQLRGTLEYNYVTAANKLVLWGSVVLPHGLMSLSLVFASLAPALALGFGVSNPLDVALGLLALFVGMVPLFSIGFIVAALTFRFKEPWAVTNVIKAFISAFSGFNYPITILPLWLQWVSRALPTTVVTEILRDALLFNRRVHAMTHHVSLLAFMGIAYPLVALGLYRRWEGEARRRGELGKY